MRSVICIPVLQRKFVPWRKKTEFFDFLAGVLQGDTLAPYLFIIALEYTMRQADGNESNLGFTLDRSRSRRHPAKVICDTDFSNDIAILPNTLKQAQLLSSRVETSAKQIGLHINNSKTEFIKFNQGEGDLKALNSEYLKNVDDFLYLGSWIECCSKDVNVRIGRAWSALHKLNTIWKSDLSVLLYGSTTWTLTQSLDKTLDGAYSKLPRVVKNVTWRQRITNDVLYAGLPRISTTVRERRLRFSGHCWRS